MAKAVCSVSFQPSGRRIFLSVVLLLSAALHSYCQNPDQIKNGGLITLIGENLSPDNIKHKVKEQTNISIGCGSDVAGELGHFNLALREVSIDSCLRVLIGDKRLESRMVNPTTYLIVDKVGSEPAAPVLEGWVKNKQGDPLARATVTVEHSGRMVLTNEEGRFMLVGEKGSVSVDVSFTNYTTTFALIMPGQPLTIVLEHNIHSLDEVLVEGYGHSTNRLETGDISQLHSVDIGKQPVGNLQAALEGRFPGLVVTQSNGVPGSAFNIQIRGQISISQGNQPLIVIDGVPMPINGSISFIASGSAYGPPGLSPLDCLNPADIENIEVLKDADATAIYGSRGANGVLLITTKRARGGPMNIFGGLSFGFSRGINTPDLMNSVQYTTMRTEAIQNDGFMVNDSSAPDLGSLRYTDFKKMAIGNSALFQDATIGVSGGKSFHYLLTGDEHQESTPFPGSRGNLRLSVFAALAYHSPNAKLDVQSSTFYCTVDNRLPLNDPTQFIYLAPNIASPYDSSGRFSWVSNGQSVLNLPAQRLNVYHGFTKNIFTHWELVYHLLRDLSVQDLSVRASLGYNSIATTETGLQPIASQDPSNNPTGEFFGAHTNFRGLIGEPQLEYSRKKGIFKLDFRAGGTLENQHRLQHGVTILGYPKDSLLGQPNPSLPTYTRDSSVLYLYEALFLRVKLNLSDKYIFTANARRDGSSRFGPGHQFGNFWSVGAAWLFQKEKFFSNLPFLTYGKLRGSYGIAGNDQIGDYQYAQSWSSNNTAAYGGIQGVSPATPGNQLLAWELVHKLEGGLELGAWKDRIFFSASWYRDWSGNQLLSKLLPLQTGYQSVTANLPAVVENTGWELVLHSQEKLSARLSWNSSLSLTIPTNRLVSFPGLASSGYAGQLAIGKSLSTQKAYHYTGVDRDSGIYRFRDVNHDGRIDGNDLVFGGNTDLRAYAGWNNEITYKGWQLTIFLEGRKQNGYDALVQLFRETPLGTATSPGMYVSNTLLGNEPVEVLHRWQHPGDNQPFQRFTATPGSAAANALNQYVYSDAALRDASFIRVKTVMLSYPLPTALLSRWHMSSCSVYISAQNLLTFSHYPVTDPETQNPNTLPPLRTLAAGIQFNL